MAMTADGFDWDAGNRTKFQKHGLTTAEIEAFLLGNPKIVPALRHIKPEERHLAVGRDSRGRAVFVVFTLRLKGGRQLIRPLSARYMHKKEIENYEAQSS